MYPNFSLFFVIVMKDFLHSLIQKNTLFVSELLLLLVCNRWGSRSRRTEEEEISRRILELCWLYKNARFRGFNLVKGLYRHSGIIITSNLLFSILNLILQPLNTKDRFSQINSSIIKPLINTPNLLYYTLLHNPFYKLQQNRFLPLLHNTFINQSFPSVNFSLSSF